jgi:tyrosine-protein phosphatase SIW14
LALLHKFKLHKLSYLIFFGFISLLSISGIKKKELFPSNFHKVNGEIYRSSQPNKQNFHAFSDIGILSVLNLRHTATDNREAKGTQIKLYHVSINTWTIEEKHLVEALKIMAKAPKPLVIHCLHGSDRTGAVIAAYRVIYENWTKKQAIEELQKKEYGYHEKIFPIIKIIIESLEVERLRKELL